MMNELESAILFLQSPFGGEPHEREHREAAQYLLDHSAEAHPRLLEMLRSNQATNPYAVIDLLPRFGLQESVPALEELMLRGPQNLAEAAAHALGAHPLDSAREALIRGLRDSKNETVVAVADGLMTRGDSSVCAELENARTHHDASVRYHVIQAAASLGCLERETLAAIAQDDPFADIRELASRLASEGGVVSGK